MAFLFLSLATLAFSVTPLAVAVPATRTVTLNEFVGDKVEMKTYADDARVEVK